MLDSSYKIWTRSTLLWNLQWNLRTMELENNGVLPFLSMHLINKSPNIERKVYVKPTSTGLLLHYESRVEARYKSSLITTMLQRAWRISSSWQHFTDECKRLEIMFSKFKNLQHMVKATIRRFTKHKNYCATTSAIDQWWELGESCPTIQRPPLRWYRQKSA